MRPRTLAGTISAMYMGETMDTAPTAKPKNVRAVASMPTDPDRAHQMEPNTKMMPPAISVKRRPNLSAMRPAVSAPTAAPTSSIEVTHPSWWALMSNAGLIKSKAPDITPVSYPKSSPPRAAMPATTLT